MSSCWSMKRSESYHDIGQLFFDHNRHELFQGYVRFRLKKTTNPRFQKDKIHSSYLGNNLFDGFELYSGLDGLYSMFANETLLLIFWLHFLSISLFAGAWVVRDARRYFIPKIVTIPSLILTYFTGPIGLIFYWFIRILFAKKISFND